MLLIVLSKWLIQRALGFARDGVGACLSSVKGVAEVLNQLHLARLQLSLVNEPLVAFVRAGSSSDQRVRLQNLKLLEGSK